MIIPIQSDRTPSETGILVTHGAHVKGHAHILQHGAVGLLDANGRPHKATCTRYSTLPPRHWRGAVRSAAVATLSRIAAGRAPTECAAIARGCDALGLQTHEGFAEPAPALSAHRLRLQSACTSSLECIA